MKASRPNPGPPTLPIVRPGQPVAFVATGLRANQNAGRPKSPKIRARRGG